jgi:cytochrome-b5 reductase
MVKLYPKGKQSPHLHAMKAGDSITFLRIPGYGWKANEQEHIALLAGGQGITPCFQLVKGILKNPDDKTRVTLVWGVNTDEDVVLRGEFGLLERQHPGRFKAVYTVAKPKEGSRFERGFVTKELLESSGVTSDSVGKVFVCGPPAMEKTLVGKTGILSGLGFDAKQVHKF